MSELNTTMDVNRDEGAEMKAETFLPDDYRPAEDEPFMNERQVEYFR
ncbi:MAG: RNA polymerase-binding protein DksA, partial [Shimia sp.]